MVGGERSTIKPLFTWRSAICDSSLPPTTRHVALTLSLYMSERGDSAHPGATRLAHDTGLTDRAVRDHLAVLVEHGWLVLIERGGLRSQKRRANSYASHIPEPPSGVEQPDPRTTFTHEPASPMNLNALTPEPDAPLPLNVVHPISSIELSKNSPNNYEVVFDAWKQATGKQRCVLDAKRRRVIEKALKDYPLDDVLDAVRGWQNSPFHCGDNDRATVYNDLTLLLRDASQIEKFRDAWRDPPRRRGKASAQMGSGPIKAEVMKL